MVPGFFTVQFQLTYRVNGHVLLSNVAECVFCMEPVTKDVVILYHGNKQGFLLQYRVSSQVNCKNMHECSLFPCSPV